ncbi:MAG: hypothetical protein AB1758_00005 [Candidatus Eremiobacterota bacterium]
MRFQLFFSFGVLTLLLAGAMWLGADLVLRHSVETVYRDQVIREGRQLAGRLSGSDTQAIQEAVRAFRLGLNGYAWMSRSAGKELFHAEREKLYSPAFVKADSSELPGLLGAYPQGFIGRLGQGVTLRYVAFYPVDGTSSVVGVTVPASETAGVLDRARTGLWVVCFALAMAGLLATFAVATLVVGPWWRVVRYAEQRAAGKATPVPDVTVPELLRLEAALNALERPQLDDEPDESALTGLPGGDRFQEALFARIDEGKPFATGLVDLTYFGPFQRRYGTERGELVVRHLAVLLKNTLGEFTYLDHQLFHLGPELPDQFAFIMDPERVEPFCEAVISRFDGQVADFYKPEDRRRGQITGKNRQGDFEQYPLMQLGVAVATNVRRPLIHPVQIGAIFQEIRSYLKTQSGSGFLVDRRTADREDTPTGEEPKPAEPEDGALEPVPEGPADSPA